MSEEGVGISNAEIKLLKLKVMLILKLTCFQIFTI